MGERAFCAIYAQIRSNCGSVKWDQGVNELEVGKGTRGVSMGLQKGRRGLERRTHMEPGDDVCGEGHLAEDKVTDSTLGGNAESGDFRVMMAMVVGIRRANDRPMARLRRFVFFHVYCRLHRRIIRIFLLNFPLPCRCRFGRCHCNRL